MLKVLTFAALLAAPNAFLAHSAAAERQLAQTNYVYSQSYDYDFKASTLINCIAGATKVLAEYKLDKGINTDSSDDNKYASVYGWNEDERITVTIQCRVKENETVLTIANYTDNGKKAYELFEKIREARW